MLESTLLMTERREHEKEIKKERNNTHHCRFITIQSDDIRVPLKSN